jgi:NADPH-dependent 2,4-dienoyl-CoA reductase/sulfur reductase-like enzyme
MIKPTKIIVVGGNAAGPAAAAKAKRINPNAEVILFEKTNYISTGTCEMPYVLSGEIDDYRKVVFFSPNEFFEEKGVKVFAKHLVEKINASAKQVNVKDLTNEEIKSYGYDALILTTGSKAKVLPQINPDIKNVFTLKNIPDLINILDHLKENKVITAAVIGAGYIGLEVAEALSKKGIEVTILEKELLPLSGAEQIFRENVLSEIEINSIKFIGGISDIEPLIVKDNVVALKIDEDTINFNLVIFAIGFAPDNFLANQIKLELGKFGGIKVDSKLRTSNRFIFAAGDNIELVNAVTGKLDYFPLAASAYDAGHVAGENAAGGLKNFEPVVKNISVKIFDKFFASVGLSSIEAERHNYKVGTITATARNKVAVMKDSQMVTGNIIYDKKTGRILGASFLGGAEVSGYVDLHSVLIKMKQTPKMLADINYNYTPPLSPFVNLLTILGKKFIERKQLG